MDITLKIPEAIIAKMEAFRLTQITDDGQYYKYADLKDMCQSNLNGGLFRTFADQVVAAAIAAAQAQLQQAQAGAAVTMPPLSPPIPVH